MAAILGISAFYHDSAAALVVDGEVVAAAQEERFTRRKHDHEFPINAIRYCLSEAGISPSDLDFVGFYDKPLLKFERLLETYLAYAPAGFRSFLSAMPLWLNQKLHLPREIRKGLQGEYQRGIIFTPHHESHAASAFFPSPFEEAAILTLDGVGEWASTSIGRGEGSNVRLLKEIRFPHSLGLLYSAFTYYCGFRVNSGEYKLMGLAPYGRPRYRDLILQHLVDIKPDGSFRLDMKYFNYCQGLTMTNRRFHDLFGGAPRKPEETLDQRHMDLAASIQDVTEEIMLLCAREAHRVSPSDNLCLAGGVALNCVGNGRILREGPFKNVWIQPAAGDAGGALGVALFIWHQLLGKPRTPDPGDSQRGSLLGPSWQSEEIRRALDEAGVVYTEHERHTIQGEAARLLSEEKVVAVVQGRMEFGPRALGARSILGDPRSPRMQSVMNLKIKFRESFRPFAPIVLKERASEYFDIDPSHESPYMLVVAPVARQHRFETENKTLSGLDLLKERRSTLPAITHVDFSARLQTVDVRRNPWLHGLLSAFEEKTGCPVLVNTSFNVRGEPIVCTPGDAVRCFLATDIDALVIENFLLLKDDQPERLRQRNPDHLSQFVPD